MPGRASESDDSESASATGTAGAGRSEGGVIHAEVVSVDAVASGSAGESLATDSGSSSFVRAFARE